jgi:hypothetical protein
MCAQKNERKTMSNEQLELGFEGAKTIRSPRRRESRATRANWWFTQMRRIVSQAIDWDTAPEPRPEQPWLKLSHHRQSA